MSNLDSKALDRLAELANVGAGHAAGAYAQLVGRTIWVDVPLIRSAPPAPGTHPTPGGWSTGVFFEFEGCLDAVVGILFPADSSEALVRRIVGMEEGELDATLIESALMEVGNILASHVASAIADTLGERLLPSIPALAMEGAEEAFDGFVEDRAGPDRVRIECALRDEAGELGGRLIVVPCQPSEDEKEPGSSGPARNPFSRPQRSGDV